MCTSGATTSGCYHYGVIGCNGGDKLKLSVLIPTISKILIDATPLRKYKLNSTVLHRKLFCRNLAMSMLNPNNEQCFQYSKENATY